MKKFIIFSQIPQSVRGRLHTPFFGGFDSHICDHNGPNSGYWLPPLAFTQESFDCRGSSPLGITIRLSRNYQHWPGVGHSGENVIHPPLPLVSEDPLRRGQECSIALSAVIFITDRKLRWRSTRLLIEKRGVRVPGDPPKRNNSGEV